MPIRSVLVANRGEIVSRVFRTCREMSLGTVAVFSDADADLPFVREADVAVALGGRTPAESYLRGDAIIAAAKAAGADAIHPGYGFLAENAGFAQAVVDAGLTWIGPPPAAIEAMGSKIEAKARMEKAGVPVLPGETVTGVDGDELLAAGERVGYPLLAKASAGGGGKGMRIVRAASELLDAVAGARREAASAFGDDALFLERYVENPRHVEVQIMGDQHGRVIAFGERECSIQRRHQKVIEEAPSPAVDDDLRASLCAAGVAAGEAIGYVGAGTVEFILDGERFYFLEVNTRLQVEHPVTEAVYDEDLVAHQLWMANGDPLPAGEPTPIGHAIEVRLYAEDPAGGYLPQTGTLERFAIAAGGRVVEPVDYAHDGPAPLDVRAIGVEVRVDTGVESGSVISPYYDPMVAKVIAVGGERDEAIRLLARALRAARVHGLTCNRDLLVRVLEHPEFGAGATDTGFLERHEGLLDPLIAGDLEHACAAAAALAGQAARRRQATALGTLPSGWRNVGPGNQEVVFDGPRGALPVTYRFARDGTTLRALTVDEHELPDPVLYSATADLVDLSIGGLRRRYAVHALPDGRVWVNCPVGQLELREFPRLPDPTELVAPGSLLSPMPGSVLRVRASAGARVSRGDVLVVIEAMKMEHEITAPADGTLAELHVTQGDQVEAGAVLAVITEDE